MQVFSVHYCLPPGVAHLAIPLYEIQTLFAFQKFPYFHAFAGGFLFFFSPSLSSQGWALHCTVLPSSLEVVTVSHLCAIHKSCRNSVYLTLWHPYQMPLKLPNTLKFWEARGRTDSWVGRTGGNRKLLFLRAAATQNGLKGWPRPVCRAPHIRLVSGDCCLCLLW